MPSIVRANPGGQATMITSATIGTGGSALKIVTKRVRTSLRTNLQDVTGDQDEGVYLQSNKLLYGSISLNGWAVTTDDIGVEELELDTQYDLTLNYASDMSATYKVKLAGIDTDHSRDSSAVGVSMLFRLSGREAADDIEA